ncbi:EthD family reductase [Pseudonocardia zijingensis]
MTRPAEQSVQAGGRCVPRNSATMIAAKSWSDERRDPSAGKGGVPISHILGFRVAVGSHPLEMNQIPRAPRARQRRSLVFQVTVLYNHPEDPAKFDAHYDEVHAPLATTIPGLQRYTVSRPGPGPDGAKPPYYLVAVLEFESEAAYGAGMSGPEGKAAVADLANFATAGAAVMAGSAVSVV